VAVVVVVVQITYTLTVLGSKFPFPRVAGPDMAELFLLVRTHAPQLPYGWNVASYGATASFYDDVGKQVRTHTTPPPAPPHLAHIWALLTSSSVMGPPTQKQAQATNTLYVRASGPWIDITYSGSLVTPEGLTVYNQQLYESNSGTVKVRPFAFQY
jgi:hypothetical protein